MRYRIISIFLAVICIGMNAAGQGKITRPAARGDASDLLSDLTKIRIGDWMTADGRYSHERFAGVDYVGVVYSLAPTEDDAKRGYTHGYIVALENAQGACQWGPGYDIKGIPNHKCSHSLIKDRNGLTYSNIPAIRETTNNAFSQARNYKKKLSPVFSQWFLPTVGQWIEIIRNLGKAEAKEVALNDGLMNISFDGSMVLSNLKRYGFGDHGYNWYWTANEDNETTPEAYVILLTRKYNNDGGCIWVSIKQNSEGHNARPVAAF